MKRLLLFLVFTVNSILVFCQVRLPRLISNNMILQRDTELRIWGWASKDEKVTIHFNNQTKSTITSETGEWKISFPPMKAGGPISMSIQGSNQIVLTNILIGDVWVCSGQSNMELPMERVKEKYSQEIESARNPNIRQFDVSTRYNFTGPLNDHSSGTWVEADPNTVLKFTAAGYFFAREIFDRYKVPVGIIKSSVGGSPAEAWLSEDKLIKYPHYLELTERYKDSILVDSIIKLGNTINNNWNNELDKADQGLNGNQKWYEENIDTNTWNKFSVPGFWDDDSLFRSILNREFSDRKKTVNTNGVVWFRKVVSVPASMTGVPTMLRLGALVDRDIAYINGKQVGTTGYQYPPRIYSVPAGVLREGENTIVIRLISTGNRGGFVPDKKYSLEAAGNEIDLSGEWKFKIGHITTPVQSRGITFQYQPAGLFNAMIAPMLNFPIKGVIWYQGESNVSKAEEYKTLFPEVIQTWREKWNRPDLPFLFVQLASFLEPRKEPGESSWAELREAQRQALSLPNTGMAVAIDIGEWNDIHPLNKKDVGKRLALAAFRTAYGDKKVVASGPQIRYAERKEKNIILHFSDIGSALIAKGDGVLKYFSVAGSDGKFRWVKASIERNTVILYCEEIDDPVKVRYAWANNPEGANLYNQEGLPASPFEIPVKK